MNEINPLVSQYGGIVLFAIVFAEQIGLPIPAIPVLLAAGALAGAGQMDLGVAILLSITACLAGDVVWYELGRRRGRQALSLLCRISLEPDFCVSRTENFFTRHGIRALILAKFLPGLSTLAPAMAGLFGIRFTRFLGYDGMGAGLWALTFVVPGYVFSSEIENIAAQQSRAGLFFLVVLGIGLVGYIGYKFAHRQWVLRELRMARITVDELKGMMDNGQEVVVLDLRGALDYEADPNTIPGALRMTPGELAQRHADIPRQGDVILFCACPNEATAARMALLLRRNGIRNVRPLAGGIDAWRERNFPLEAHSVAVPTGLAAE
ncbi:MAG: DedA family protein/thiosulfate sulfurtransferase GlpE [Nitrospirales bacterium]|nr:DedA family protein/thiosulfate sulfurtransferase GlpE [Nitrospirales bacterium]